MLQQINWFIWFFSPSPNIYNFHPPIGEESRGVDDAPYYKVCVGFAYDHGLRTLVAQGSDVYKVSEGKTLFQTYI